MAYDLHGLSLKKNETQWMNDKTFFDYYTRLKELAVNQFEWINLPKTCDARFMELILYEFGYCLFFRHELNRSFFNLQCTLEGPLNMYRIPIRRRTYAITGYQQECDDTNSVIVWNNYLRQPTALTIELFARRLTEIQRAIDVNINGQKTPVLLYGTEAQQKTLRRVYQQWQGNEPVIFGDKQLQENPIQAIKTDVPESYVNLMRAKNTIWNEAMSFLGIDNTNTDKRERMITDEVESNNQLLKSQRYIFLNARKEACELINDLFAGELDGKVDVKFRDYGEEVNDNWLDTPRNSEPSANQS